jgi:hypothetical protein
MFGDSPRSPKERGLAIDGDCIKLDGLGGATMRKNSTHVEPMGSDYLDTLNNTSF